MGMMSYTFNEVTRPVVLKRLAMLLSAYTDNSVAIRQRVDSEVCRHASQYTTRPVLSSILGYQRIPPLSRGQYTLGVNAGYMVLLSPTSGSHQHLKNTVLSQILRA